MKTAPRKEKEKRGDGNELLGARVSFFLKQDFFLFFNTPQAKCDVHRIDVNEINSEKATIAVYRILGMCDVHRI